MLGLFGGAAIDWADIVGHLNAENTNVTMPNTATISASSTLNPAAVQLYYVKNGGAPVNYSGSFSVAANDTLHWGVQTKGTGSGTVTVSAGAVVIDTFQVTLT